MPWRLRCGTVILTSLAVMKRCIRSQRIQNEPANYSFDRNMCREIANEQVVSRVFVGIREAIEVQS